MGNLLQRIGAFLLYGGSFALRSYERRCIDFWVENLPIGARRTIELQLAKLDRYKRLHRGKVLLLFPTGWPNGVPLPSELRVPLREDESRVARIKLSLEGASRIVCDAVIVMRQGQLASLEFSKQPPLEAGECSANLLSIQRLRDVCSPSSKHGAEREVAEFPEGFQWISAELVRDMRGPRSEEEVQDFLSSIDAKLPEEYRALLGKTNGFSFGSLTIYGVGDAWTVPRPSGPFVVLGNVAEIGDIACKIGDHEGRVYLLDAESDNVTQLPHGFSQSLRELVSKSHPLDNALEN